MKEGTNMASTFLFALNAVLPIFILIILGYFLKKSNFIDTHFVNILNKFVFRVGLPVLLFYNVYNINHLSEINWGVVAFAVIGIMLSFFIGILSLFITTKDREQKGVILQCIIRSNFALIGIPLAMSLGGVEAVAVVAILSLFTIPLANLLSVIALNMYHVNEFGERISVKKMMINIISNPLIIGVMLGLFALLIRSWIPVVDGELVFSIKNNLTFSYDAMRLLSQTASPMALIALGGQFEISVIKPLIKQITLGVMWRIVIVPSIMLSIAYMLEDKIVGMSHSYAALISLFGAPVAVSSAIMVHEMGGDEKLAAQLVVWTTVFSVFTIFAIVVVFRSLGAL
ncbi:AEC family transporter [Peloplasma aerotolerans]|uniref:AEC family transporter n=1 Tax=Peloplasma aerotolerans TaxID=3044389 RepID=A0AAW6U7X7_9MOLU|nr:AEC family transporter [Mariniplasma sp. M4Ah]MDI6452729.1 AEC family transporter [Mariniplasma sp. M4Ah]